LAASDGHRPQTSESTVGPSFEEIVLPHQRAALRLARWMMRNDYDAEDVVQEALLRAVRYFRTFAGGNGRAWFLRIVRNTGLGWRGRRDQPLAEPFDENRHGSPRSESDPEARLRHAEDVAVIERAMSRLPERYRELLVLRELQGLSYQEVAAVMGIPMGTVMSGLSRARRAFRRALQGGRIPSEDSREASPPSAVANGESARRERRRPHAEAV
jgi:RNA polymerase sigma-70 factor (ECF subfamily)